MFLKIGIFSLKDDAGCTRMAMHIANYIINSEKTVAVVESKTVQNPEFDNYDVEYQDDGTFVLNSVHYYPQTVKIKPTEDVVIYLFKKVHILYHFDMDFDKLYLCSESDPANLPDVTEYITENEVENCELLLFGASKEELNIWKNEGYKCVVLKDTRDSIIPYELYLQVSTLLRTKNIIAPTYNRDAVYDEIKIDETLKQKSLNEPSKGLFGLFGKKKKNLKSSYVTDNKPKDVKHSDIEIAARKNIEESNEYENTIYIDVPKPPTPEERQSLREKREKERKEYESKCIKEENALKLKQHTEKEKAEAQKRLQEIELAKQEAETVKREREELEQKAELEKKQLEKERSEAKAKIDAKQKELQAEKAKLENELQRQEKLKADEEELQSLRYKATHDELTKTKNRTGFNEDIKMFENKDYAIITTDVNNLKVTNDKYGHDKGDELLLTISKELLSKFDYVYRMGGDEFTVIVPGISKEDSTKIESKLNDIDSNLKKLTSKSKILIYELACGVAYSSEGTLTEIQKLADGRMYDDKAFKKQSRIQEQKKEPSAKRKLFGRKNEQKTILTGHISVFVTELRHSSGATYIAGSIASALTDIYDQDVWLDHKIGDPLPDNIMVQEVKNDMDRFNAYKNGLVVIDKGIYEDLTEIERTEMLRSDMNVMVCTADEDGLQRLSAFIKEHAAISHQWIYAFNHVQNSQKKTIMKAMKGYDYLIIPFHDSAEVPDNLRHDYKSALEYCTSVLKG